MELGRLPAPPPPPPIYRAQGIGYRDPRDQDRDGAVSNEEARAFDAARPELALAKQLRTAASAHTAARQVAGPRQDALGDSPGGAAVAERSRGLPGPSTQGGLGRAQAAGGIAPPGRLLDLWG